MKRGTKVLIVLGGYAAALAAALACSAVRYWLTNTPDRDASGGMYAFGDMLWFCFALAAFALPATAAALYFLRAERWFWKTLSAACLVVAFTGVGAMAAFFAGRSQTAGLLGTLAGLSVLRILAAPPLGALHGLCAVFAPEKGFRLALGGALLLEIAGFAPVAVFWVLGAR